MATIDKHFKVKHGIVVEGTVGTINGEDILTKAQADQDYITNLVGGTGTAENTPDTLVKRDSGGDFAAGTVTVTDINIGTIGHIWDDGDLMISNVDNQDVILQGEDIRLNAQDDVRLNAGTGGDVFIQATSGNINLQGPNVYVGENLNYVDAERVASQGYVDDAITNIDLTFNSDEITEGTTNLYFTNGRAVDAVTAVVADGITTDNNGPGGNWRIIADTSVLATRTYADGVGTDANNYTNSQLEAYTLTSELDTTVDGYGYLKSADLSSYATTSYVDTAVSDLVGAAPELLDTLNELAAAIGDDANYATTVSDLIAGKQNNLTAGSGTDITDDTISINAGNGLDFDAGQLVIDTGVVATKTYVDGLASNYDAAGAATTAESNANSYTDTQLNSYTPTSSLETTIDGYGFAYSSEIPGSTDSLTEGTSNLYFTDGRAESAITTGLIGNASAGYQAVSVDFVTGNLVVPNTDISNFTTDELTEGETNLYFTDSRAVDAIDTVAITPGSVRINNYRKEEAEIVTVPTATTVTAHTFASPFESVKYLVRVISNVGGVKHSHLTEILATVDGGNNIAVTEYGTIYTSENPLATFTMDYSGGNFRLRATTLADVCEVITVATLMSWSD